MITLKQLQDEWAADSKIDELNLGSESTKTPILHSKYLNHLTNFKLHQQKVESHNYDIRKQILRFDDILNDQRKIIYQNSPQAQ